MYDKGSTDVDHDLDPGVNEIDQDMNELESYPNGSENSWTFFYNLVHAESGLNIKLGDCVEAAVDEQSETKVFRCQFLLRDKENAPWISGYEMVRTSDIPPLLKKGKKRKRRPADEFPISGDRVILDASECFMKLNCIKKIVCILPLTDYEFGKPKGIKNSEDVSSCGFRFYPETGLNVNFVTPDFKTCFDPLVWERFVEPLELDPVVIVSCTDDSKMSSPSILKKQGCSRKSLVDRRISFSTNLVQRFEFIDHSE